MSAEESIVHVGDTVYGRLSKHFREEGTVESILGDGKAAAFTVTWKNGESTKVKRRSIWSVAEFVAAHPQLIQSSVSLLNQSVPILPEIDVNEPPVPTEEEDQHVDKHRRLNSEHEHYLPHLPPFSTQTSDVPWTSTLSHNYDNLLHGPTLLSSSSIHNGYYHHQDMSVSAHPQHPDDDSNSFLRDVIESSSSQYHTLYSMPQSTDYTHPSSSMGGYQGTHNQAALDDRSTQSALLSDTGNQSYESAQSAFTYYHHSHHVMHQQQQQQQVPTLSHSQSFPSLPPLPVQVHFQFPLHHLEASSAVSPIQPPSTPADGTTVVNNNTGSANDETMGNNEVGTLSQGAESGEMRDVQSAVETAAVTSIPQVNNTVDSDSEASVQQTTQQTTTQQDTAAPSQANTESIAEHSSSPQTAPAPALDISSDSSSSLSTVPPYHVLMPINSLSFGLRNHRLLRKPVLVKNAGDSNETVTWSTRLVCRVCKSFKTSHYCTRCSVLVEDLKQRSIMALCEPATGRDCWVEHLKRLHVPEGKN